MATGRAFRQRPQALAPPAVEGLSAPEIQIVGRSAAAGGRRVKIRLKANGAETVALVAPEDAQLVAAGSGAFVRPISKEAKDGRYTVRCFGRSCDGLTMEMVIGKAGPVEFIVVGSRAGLPPSARPLLAARPKFARPQYSPDATITMSRLRL